MGNHLVLKNITYRSFVVLVPIPNLKSYLTVVEKQIMIWH